jgi:hypothetical protein
MSATELVGTWKLVSVTAQRADGETSEPYGHEPHGILVYGDDGRVVTVIVHSNLERFKSDSIAAASSAESSRAFRRTLAYFGRYEVDSEAGTVIHHIDTCTFPNWTGEDEVRQLEVENGRLVMSTPPLPSLGGHEAVFTLVWERA